MRLKPRCQQVHSFWKPWGIHFFAFSRIPGLGGSKPAMAASLPRVASLTRWLSCASVTGDYPLSPVTTLCSGRLTRPDPLPGSGQLISDFHATGSSHPPLPRDMLCPRVQRSPSGAVILPSALASPVLTRTACEMGRWHCSL